MARLVVERVDVRPYREGTERVVTEVGNFTVKADELPGLITKLAQHAALVDDITAIDPRTTHNVGGTKR